MSTVHEQSKEKMRLLIDNIFKKGEASDDLTFVSPVGQQFSNIKQSRASTILLYEGTNRCC